MIILSFTRRDAEALKVKAVQMIYDGHGNNSDEIDAVNGLGTVRVFSLSECHLVSCSMHSITTHLTHHQHPLAYYSSSFPIPSPFSPKPCSSFLKVLSPPTSPPTPSPPSN